MVTVNTMKLSLQLSNSHFSVVGRHDDRYYEIFHEKYKVSATCREQQQRKNARSAMVSMDGPNVNLKFEKLFREDCITNHQTSFLEIGTCNQHIVHIHKVIFILESKYISQHKLCDQMPLKGFLCVLHDCKERQRDELLAYIRCFHRILSGDQPEEECYKELLEESSEDDDDLQLGCLFCCFS
ncbi:hypothetical protein CAPTEDRAFT_201151 [Capitella teleta]|uniref:Uncharacterized protein n=1 Tax=Capitella teleta TaxID=283909 RepID=R7VHH3_CAPTE|nr:hypothetical protein CAPTEDRAFT_201151 [Capitella teleta]|eukprot:ELU15731.1 hypothetical protein CAPTEDRAFT_201151 [Capitella teleta]